LLYLPGDPFFVAAIASGKFTLFHAFAIFLGMFASYSINYIIGMKLSTFSRNLVSPKNFYKTKAIINKFGSPAIFFINLVGFGSQQLIFVLGVFKYNRTRLFVLSFTGQLLRALIVAGFTLMVT
jgi:membrane protein DedA with SNARE-associated domain